MRPLQAAQEPAHAGGIAYDEVDIERHPEAAEFVMSVNNGNQVVPTVVTDCHTMTNPSVAEVKRHLAGAC